jgi:hypothetical protein
MTAVKTAILLLASIPFASIAATDYLKKDEPFIEARSHLLKEQWKPLKVHLGTEEYISSNVSEDLIKRGFDEAFACSVDTSNCDFFYEKNGKCLRLDTVGEDIKSMKVVRWSEECPPRKY